MNYAPALKASYDDFDAASDETGLDCKDESLTQQHDEPEANINNIVRRYTQTGELPIRNMPPLQGDFTDVPDYQTALNLMVEAKNAFMEQPAEVRARFENDPGKFVEFCSNEENRDDMRKMGLLSQEEMARHHAKQEGLKAEAARNKSDAEAFRKAQDGPKS